MSSDFHVTTFTPMLWAVLTADRRYEEYVSVRGSAERFEKALLSIANSACCGSCQEAALVAKAALREPSTEPMSLTLGHE